MITIERVEELDKIYKGYHKTYIYGAGKCAEFVSYHMDNIGGKIEAFLVSDDGRRGTCSDRLFPVFALNEVEILDEDLVIVAVVDAKIVNEILEALDNVKNIVCFAGDKLPWAFIDRKRMAERSRQTGFFSEMKLLQSLGEREGTDKAEDWHNYCNKYDFFLDKWRNKDITFVELGVKEGASIRMWRAYFEKARVVGVDIEEKCLQYAGERIEVLIRDMGKQESIDDIAELSPSIIVDDASHKWSHQTSGLFQLFPVLPSGGVYILEDICTSFFPDRDIYGDQPVSAYDVIETIAKGVVGDSVMDLMNRDYGSFIPDIVRLISMTEAIVSITDSIILIKR